MDRQVEAMARLHTPPRIARPDPTPVDRILLERLFETDAQADLFILSHRLGSEQSLCDRCWSRNFLVYAPDFSQCQPEDVIDQLDEPGERVILACHSCRRDLHATSGSILDGPGQPLPGGS